MRFEGHTKAFSSAVRIIACIMLQQRRQQKGEEEPDHVSLVGGQPLQAPPLHVGGHRLDCLFDVLRSALRRDIGEISKSTSSKQFIRKCKAFLCIGVNNVTRALERMPCTYKGFNLLSEKEEQVEEIPKGVERQKGARGTSPLQVVIVAIDVHPRLLISHFPGLAASRKVPLITLSGGNGSGSLRLGELFNLRTAIAIGLKAGDSEVNKAIRRVLEDWSEMGTT